MKSVKFTVFFFLFQFFNKFRTFQHHCLLEGQNSSPNTDTGVSPNPFCNLHFINIQGFKDYRHEIILKGTKHAQIFDCKFISISYCWMNSPLIIWTHKPGSRQVNHMKRQRCGTGRVYGRVMSFLSLISVFMPVMKMALQGDIKSIELNWIVLCDLWLPGTDRPLIKRLFVSLSALTPPINEDSPRLEMQL